MHSVQNVSVTCEYVQFLYVSGERQRDYPDHADSFNVAKNYVLVCDLECSFVLIELSFV